jgi:hypothetical protein
MDETIKLNVKIFCFSISAKLTARIKQGTTNTQWHPKKKKDRMHPSSQNAF